MAEEIKRLYPSAPPVPVIRLAPFAAATPPTPARARAVVAALGLQPPYILCPTHLSVHKNLGPLIAAHERISVRFPAVKLVVTGLWTDAATGHATSIGSVRDGAEPNVIGLGYVSNEQIDSLIECAAVVVNPSLYEAGNGSGLDAWSRGVPVAMSEIPSFVEHIEAFGVRAALFDPRSPDDIAEKISDILDQPETWQGYAAASRDAVRQQTWAQVAGEYLDVFDSALAASHHG
jgi:glycosyltransferase involved in cell wall biosynthesis